MTWDASHLISSLYLYINIYLFILDVRYSTSRIKIFFKIIIFYLKEFKQIIFERLFIRQI
jgi:hypothetical protein